LPAEGEKLLRLQNELRTELTKNLSAEERFEYEVRSSPVSGQMRYLLAALRPTEAEFRALFPLYRSLEEQFPTKFGADTPEEMAPRVAAEKAMQEQFKTLLGAERYAEFQLSRDYNYQQAAKVTERLRLPATATTQVYAVQQEIQQRAAALRVNRTLSADDRTAQLSALATEASERISSVFGPSGLEAYKQYGGQWLQQLTPRPRPNTKAP
jgi:hypothetical protein